MLKRGFEGLAVIVVPARYRRREKIHYGSYGVHFRPRVFTLRYLIRLKRKFSLQCIWSKLKDGS